MKEGESKKKVISQNAAVWAATALAFGAFITSAPLGAQSSDRSEPAGDPPQVGDREYNTEEDLPPKAFLPDPTEESLSQVEMREQIRLPEKVDDWLGKPVYSSLNEKVGKVGDVVIDLQEGDASHVLVEVAGESAKSRLVSVDAVRPNVIWEKRFNLAMTTQQFKEAPEYDQDRGIRRNLTAGVAVGAQGVASRGEGAVASERRSFEDRAQRSGEQTRPNAREEGQQARQQAPEQGREQQQRPRRGQREQEQQAQQERQQPGARQQEQQQQQAQRYVFYSEVGDAVVESREGEQIGTISGVIRPEPDGEFYALVGDLGNALELSDEVEKLAIKLQGLRSVEEGQFQADLTRGDLRKADQASSRPGRTWEEAEDRPVVALSESELVAIE